MIIGFTGTRKGMNAAQREQVYDILYGADAVHHGDCIGADADMHEIAVDLGTPVHVHPCNLETQRAFCEGAVSVAPVKKPLDRNHDIVDACDVLIACPGGPEQFRGSGTWAAIRYARKVGKPVRIFM